VPVAAKKRGIASLTSQQTRVYNIIRDYLRDHNGQSPTLREIATYMGFQSVNGVMCHMRALVKKGVVVRTKNQARGIQITVEEPIRVVRFGDIIKLDCGDRVYDLDEVGAAQLGEVLIRTAGRPRV
jgi:SOS-response transcriptional repressor LexA